MSCINAMNSFGLRVQCTAGCPFTVAPFRVKKFTIHCLQVVPHEEHPESRLTQDCYSFLLFRLAIWSVFAIDFAVILRKCFGCIHDQEGGGLKSIRMSQCRCFLNLLLDDPEQLFDFFVLDDKCGVLAIHIR